MTEEKSSRQRETLSLIGLIAAPVALILGAYFFLEHRFVDEPIFDFVTDDLKGEVSELRGSVEIRQNRLVAALAANSSAVVNQIQRLERRRAMLLLQTDVDRDAVLEIEDQIEALVNVFRSETLALTASGSE